MTIDAFGKFLVINRVTFPHRSLVVTARNKHGIHVLASNLAAYCHRCALSYPPLSIRKLLTTRPRVPSAHDTGESKFLASGILGRVLVSGLFLSKILMLFPGLGRTAEFFVALLLTGTFTRKDGEARGLPC